VFVVDASESVNLSCGMEEGSRIISHHSLKILLQVLFVCTANVVENIPNPLLDRMEVISIAGYITDEKMRIARDYLEKTTREACGIELEQVLISISVCLAVTLLIIFAY
jgi:ATP-dependent Lon protease